MADRVQTSANVADKLRCGNYFRAQNGRWHSVVWDAAPDAQRVKKGHYLGDFERVREMKKRESMNYVTVRNGRVELRSTAFSGAIHVFSENVTSAVMQNEVIIVTQKNGRVSEYRVTPQGTGVMLVRVIS